MKQMRRYCLPRFLNHPGVRFRWPKNFCSFSLSGFSFFGPLYLVGEQFPQLITLAARKEDLNR